MTDLDSHEKQEDPTEEYKTPGLEGDKYGRKTQLSPSISKHNSFYWENGLVDIF